MIDVEAAILINCARGGVVDEKEVARALNSEMIFGAGIDVFGHEPPNPNDELLRCANVIISPHSASLSQEASIRTAEMCARGCIAVRNGEHWPYVADKSAYNYKFIERKQEK